MALTIFQDRKYRYNSNTFGIPAHGELTPVMQDSGLPAAHKNYIVHNIGRTELYAKLKYGTKVIWHGVADEGTIKPGERRIMNNWGSSFFVTAVKIYNRTAERAVVHASLDPGTFYLYVEKTPGTFDIDRNNMLKEIFALGIKHIPHIGAEMSALVKAFWPKSPSNAWEQVHEKVAKLLHQRVLDTISGILGGDIRQYERRITTLSEEIEKGENLQNIRSHYLNIAQDLIGFEEKFKFGKEVPEHQSVNKHILPHFSTTVMMKTSFYVMGILQRGKIGLTAQDVTTITSYANTTIHGDRNSEGANKYIEDMYKERIDDAYRTGYAEDLYDVMMNIRSFIGTQGLEYIRIWNFLVQNLTENGIYNDVISYSTLFGRQTPNVIARAITENHTEPLTPQLINGRRNKLSSIDCYFWRNQGGLRRIGGLKVKFENNSSYTLGTVEIGFPETVPLENQLVPFNGALLNKLKVYGDGAIDRLDFHFSDGRVVTVGEKENKTKDTIFELKDHHIVGIFLATDNYSLAGQAANISVAYKFTDN